MPTRGERQRARMQACKCGAPSCKNEDSDAVKCSCVGESARCWRTIHAGCGVPATHRNPERVVCVPCAVHNRWRNGCSDPACRLVRFSPVPGSHACRRCGRRIHGACGLADGDDPNYRTCHDCRLVPHPGWPPQEQQGGRDVDGGARSAAAGVVTAAAPGRALPSAVMVSVSAPAAPRLASGRAVASGAPLAGTNASRTLPSGLAALSRTEVSKLALPRLRELAREANVPTTNPAGRARLRMDLVKDLRQLLPRKRKHSSLRAPSADTVQRSVQSTLALLADGATRAFPGPLREATVPDPPPDSVLCHARNRGVSLVDAGTCTPTISAVLAYPHTLTITVTHDGVVVRFARIQADRACLSRTCETTCWWQYSAGLGALRRTPTLIARACQSAGVRGLEGGRGNGQLRLARL